MGEITKLLHDVEQGSPAPSDRVPSDWKTHLHAVHEPPPHLRRRARP